MRDLAAKATVFLIVSETEPTSLRNLWKKWKKKTGTSLWTSPKYKAYQQKIRNRQIERAEQMISSQEKKRKGKNQNDPARFIQKTSLTEDGELASKCIYSLDQNRIDEEAMYDGFYAVITNLEGDIGEIIRINRQRWEIEENFRLMK